MTISNTTPVYAVPDENLVPVSDHLSKMMDIPPSRMFLIKKSLKVYADNNPGSPIYDASQGDGGASVSQSMPRRNRGSSLDTPNSHATMITKPVA